MKATERSAGDDLPKKVVTERPTPPRARRSRRFLWIGVVFAVVLSIGMVGMTVDLPVPGGPQAPVATAPPQPAVQAPDLTRQVAALGRLEPASGIISVAPPPAASDAPVLQLLVAEGQRVEVGEALAVLGTTPRAQAALQRAEADVAAQQVEVTRTSRSLEREQAEAKAAMAISEARLEEAERVVTRLEALSSSASASQAALDEARTERDVALSELDQSRVRAAQVMGDLSQHPDALAAERALSVALAEQRLAEIDLLQGRLYAPIGGTILDVVVRPGERPDGSGVVRLADTTTMVVRMEIHQNRIDRVSLGDPVTIVGETLQQPLLATVTSIGLEVQDQGIIGTDPVASNNARVFDVLAQLDAASTAIAERLINLQVLATVEVGE